MRVLRGRAETIAADRQVSADMADRAGETGEAALRVWAPHPQVAFGRRDANREGYEEARAIAERRGFPPIEREVGGRAVVYGSGTLAFALAEPRDGGNRAVGERYERVLEDLTGGLEELGVAVERGEPPDSFCPGSYSLQADGKVAGLAQRVTGDVAVVGGYVVVSGAAELAEVIEPIYEALSVPFDPDSVGSLAGAGGPRDLDTVARGIEECLAGDRPIRVEPVTD